MSFEKYAVSSGINSNTLKDVIDNQNKIIGSVGTPMITEEKEYRVSQMSVFDRMMMDRIIWVSGPVESRMAAIIQAQIMYLNSVDNTLDITMHLDTPGGSVLNGLGIVDVMNYVDTDISTINLGMCASMGSVLLSSGTKGKRYSLLYSKVMTHMVSHGTSGNVQDTRINQHEAEKYNYILFKMLAENCGCSFEEIYELSKRDKWFNSDESKAHGLIDDVIGAKGSTITQRLEGFDDYYTKIQKNL